MSPGAAQGDAEPWIAAQRRERDLQGEQEELLGRDERPAPCAQEVHQVALTEKDKMSQDQLMDRAAKRLCLLQVLQCLA